MGYDEHLEHDTRYDRADEFMEVVLGHWNSWDDDAIVIDKQTGLFAHPDKVRRLDHQGRWFRSRGPFTVPRSPQGHPVVIQAGQSGRGKQFSTRWGELIFVSTHTSMEHGRQLYRELKDDVARQGRDPDHFFITPSAYVVCAETKAEAEDKMALIETLATDEDALSLLSEAMNFDFASKGLDEPFTDDELANISGTQSMRDRVLRASGITNPTPRDFVSLQPPRAAEQAVRRRPEGGGGRAGAMVHRAGRRRLRAGGDARARHLHGLCAATSCRSCSGAACITRTTRARRCGRTSACRSRAHRTMEERTMKLGLSIGYSRAHLEIPVKLVQRAEELGYDSVWTAEAYGTDAVTPLAYLAAVTKRIKLGTGIMQLAARTPANAAMCAATVDAMAGGGRFIAGLGVSGPQIVEGWYGEPWGRPYYRYKDYVAIMRKIFRREAPVTHEGREISPALHRRRRRRRRQAAEIHPAHEPRHPDLSRHRQ